jgi:ABC-type multidrug transport system ATPase subunit
VASGVATLILDGGQADEENRVMAIIEARGLARNFKSRKRVVEAVRGVDLTVGEGEIVGFLGPNGAGKTTTLRMLTTLLKPTAGTATVAGANLLSNPLEVRKKIAGLRSDLGTTVFLTTHYLEEADVLCDRVFIIDHGVIAAEGTPDELKRRISGDVVTLRVAGGEHGAAVARKLLADQALVREISTADGSLKLTVERGEQALPALLRVLDAADVTLESINLARPTLDDVFLTLTGRSLRDDSHPAAAPQGRAAAPEPASASAGQE